MEHESPHPTRRGVLSALGAGWALLALSGGAMAAGLGRCLMRDAGFASTTVKKLGFPEDYELGISMRYEAWGIALAKTEEGLYALSTACTYDSGCICLCRDDLREFHC